MAATNYTPIQLYFSTTASAVPLAANLAQGELAININDGKLYYENSSGVVTLLASATTVTNSFSAGTTGLTPNTATTGAVTLAGTLAVANGGTGLTAGTSGGVLAYTATGTLASSTALAASALVIGGGAGAAPSTTTTGTGVVTALGVNTGTAGAFVVNGGALGSPSTAGTMPAFTLGGTVSGGGNQINNVVIGTTTPLAGNFTTLTTSSTVTHNGGTANGVGYLNGSKVLTTGTALTFDGTTATTPRLAFGGTTLPSAGTATIFGRSSDNNLYLQSGSGNDINFLDGSQNTMLSLAPATLTFQISNVNKLTLNSTGLAVTNTLSGGTSGTAYSFSGSAPATSLTLDSSGNLGIGTSSPAAKLHIAVASAAVDGTKGVRITNPAGTIAVFECGSTGDSFIGTTSGSDFNIRTSNTVATTFSNIGIVTMPAYGAGAATFSAAGVISSVSDETWKIKDGVPVDTDAMLKKLEPGYWYYNDEKKETFGADRQLGFYAQNVNAAIGPEAAPTPEEGKPWGYYDRSVLAITVMSLQKALATIETLTARITALETA